MRWTTLFAVAAGTLASAPLASAQAYETLAEMVGIFPDSIEAGSSEFYFISPELIDSWPLASWPGIGFSELNLALIDPEVGVEQAGVDFSRLEGIAHWGTPPFHLLYFVGDDIAPDAIREALLRRPNMVETERNGVAVLAEGDDLAVDLAAREPGYPFGGGWRAHRVAVEPGFAILTFGWGAMDVAMEAAAEPGTLGDQAMLGAMVAAAEEAVPSGFSAFFASSLPLRAFELTADAEPPAIIPRFNGILYVSAIDRFREALQIVLSYDDVADAFEAASLVAENLLSFPGILSEGGVIEKTIVEGPDGAIVVVTVSFRPPTGEHPASLGQMRILNDAYRRGYQVIAVEVE